MGMDSPVEWNGDGLCNPQSISKCTSNRCTIHDLIFGNLLILCVDVRSCVCMCACVCVCVCVFVCMLLKTHTYTSIPKTLTQ